MARSIFRKKSIDRISSPEELDKTVRVASVPSWIILIVIVLLLAGILVWTGTATIDGVHPIKYLFN